MPSPGNLADIALNELLDEREKLAAALKDWYRRWCDCRQSSHNATTVEAIEYSHGLRSLDDLAIEAVCAERGVTPPRRQASP